MVISMVSVLLVFGVGSTVFTARRGWRCEEGNIVGAIRDYNSEDFGV